MLFRLIDVNCQRSVGNIAKISRLITVVAISCVAVFVAITSTALANTILATGTEHRYELTAKTLLQGASLPNWISMSSFTAPDSPSLLLKTRPHKPQFVKGRPANKLPLNTFEGRLVLSTSRIDSDIKIIRDDSKVFDSKELKVQQLPKFDFEFVQDGRYLIPKRRGTIASDHPYWEYVLEPGRVWQELGDGEYSRTSLPFSLQQRNANCIHNGVLSFLFKDDGSVSQVAFQIASETCLYLKFDSKNLLAAKYHPKTVKKAEVIRKNYRKALENRLPVKPIARLETDYPGIDSRQFGSKQFVNKEDMTVYGFVVDGTHYVGGCDTRHGAYPYCEMLDLPSYSLAKSIMGGFGLMRMEKLYPDTKNLLIADYVPQCKVSGNWENVKLEHVLDMATGNFNVEGFEVDEGSEEKGALFFSRDSHNEKINFACNQYLKKTSPGKKWNYHTSDTYLLGVALNSLTKKRLGSDKDFYRDIILPLFEDLSLSPTIDTVRRSYDSYQQPFTGYGMTFRIDDIAKIAQFTQQDNSLLLDAGLFNSALQRVKSDRGLAVGNTGLRYNNGFWASNLKKTLGCKNEVWLPFMSGFGGISVVMMPNNTAYYYFSDGGVHGWKFAARESNKLKPFCQ